ncbi:MAG: YfcE family phosphodiesterase [Clostridia bacterium]|nr:YfcE family phosphodiesterase [Clostridia bacterium]
MKILVLSDSHEKTTQLETIIRLNSAAEVVVFCGDGNGDIEDMRHIYPEKMFISVRGNCDWCCNVPDREEITLCGKKIFITHGHLYGVKQGLSRITEYGHSINADIVLFGHTHQQIVTVDGSMLLMNPGSLGFNAEYGIIDIDDSGKITAQEYPPYPLGKAVIQSGE